MNLQVIILSRFDEIFRMIKTASIVRPSRLQGLYNDTRFIPANSKDQLIEVDMGFNINPIYRQEKLCYFSPENIYYQKLSIVDGKMNPIKDDARTIVLTGETDGGNLIKFTIEVYPALPATASINQDFILLPFYPEINTEIVVKDSKIENNIFYHFSCIKIIHKANGVPYLQLRHLNNYNITNLAAVLRKWHSTDITMLENITGIQ